MTDNPPSSAVGRPPSGAGPLAGIKVADFTWFAAGPLASQWLGNLGAEVIHVESAGQRLDPMRQSGPFAGGQFGINRSIYYSSLNANKLGIALNLNHPRGPEVARRLIAWADVLVENYTPRGMRKWGLDYERLRPDHPGLVMISMATQGQTGPQALSRSTGSMLQALSGLNHLTGWPDRGPTGAMIPYPDFVTPHFAAFAVICALDYRRRTGRGQYIDLSQLEAFVHTLDAAPLDAAVNGRIQRRAGNQLIGGGAPIAAPHGAYPCRPRPTGPNPDRYLALAVFDDADWARLKTALGAPAWTDDPRFATHGLRCANVEALDAAISAWSAEQNGEELVRRLQAAGVAAGMVADQQDLWEDPQLRHRGHFVPLTHSEAGELPLELPAARLSRTPASLRRAFPSIGEHNEHVLTEILGYGAEEYSQLVLEGVVEYYEGN
jgi:benzylsuccinate CoA-transferase BbsF subunit